MDKSTATEGEEVFEIVTYWKTVASFAVTAFTRANSAASKLVVLTVTLTKPLTITLGSSVAVQTKV